MGEALFDVGDRVRVVGRDDAFDLCEGVVTKLGTRSKYNRRHTVRLTDPPPHKPSRSGLYYFMPDELERLSDAKGPGHE